jgi:SAM-dependent methyltransferase
MVPKPERESQSGEYWKRKIVSWEAGAYYKERENQKRSFWDGLSSLFRGDDMYVRMQAALDLVRPHLNGMTVLDIGCASGRFATQLLEAGAARVIGVDVAPAAIALANQAQSESPLAEMLEFYVADAVDPETEFPKVDLVTALGVLEYFDTPAMHIFLKNLRTQYFFFDFPDVSRKQDRLKWWLRQVYLKINRCPGVYLYAEGEFRELAAQYGYTGIHFEPHFIFDFATNLPAGS